MRYFQVYFSNTVAFRKNYSCIELSCLSCSLICKLELKYGVFFEKQSSSWASCILAVCRGDEILPEIFHFDSCQVWQLSNLTAVKVKNSFAFLGSFSPYFTVLFFSLKKRFFPLPSSFSFTQYKLKFKARNATRFKITTYKANALKWSKCW